MKSRQTQTEHASPLLLVILVAVSLAITTVYHREGQDGPLRTVRRGVLAVAAPIAKGGDILTSPFRAVAEWFGGLSVDRAEYEQMRQQNNLLRQSVAELEEARQENERLRGLVGFAEARKLESLGARIIGRPTTPWEGAVTIDRGSEDGLKVGMPVLAEEGLLGQVVQVSSRSARVRLITDQRSGVAAIVQRTRVSGVVRGSLSGDLTLDFVDKKLTPRKGDVVLTSGMGGIYPKGLFVGEVMEVESRASDLFPKVKVRSRVPFARLEEVLVLTGAPPVIESGAGE